MSVCLSILVGGGWLLAMTSTVEKNERKKEIKTALKIRTAIGKLAYLRVHELGSGFGLGFDFLDVEAVIGIHGTEGGFGFTLRNDDKPFAHQGMLDLPRDVFNSDTVVEVEFTVDPGSLAKTTA